MLLHDKAIRDYGGVAGVKNEGLLDSALDPPLNKLAYSDPPGPDLFDLAAAYAFGIAANHAFHDGNKRTAWNCCVVFLDINGCRLDVAATEAVEQVVGLIERQLDEADFAAWLRRVAC